MTALTRKLLREFWRLRGQMMSIALVVATGIMTVVVMRGSFESLVQAQEAYYREARFAQVWANLKRAPRSLEHRVIAIPGVAAVESRVKFAATLDLPGLNAPGQGLFLSIPERGRPRLNDVRVVAGRYIDGANPDEILISKNFAGARKLGPGATLAAIINGRARTLQVVGVALSPEHTYAVPPGALQPEDERFGIIWMGRRALSAAYDLDGAFNEVMVTLTPEANELAVISRLDRFLEPYGGLGAYPRTEQLSHQILQGELDQNRVMGTVIPAVFLGVAAFLLHLVLGRLIATQRTELAVLKAFGYRNAEVARHYLSFAVVAVSVGSLLGVGLGAWLGRAYIKLYGAYFNFPELEYRLSLPLALLAIGVSLLASVAGAWGAVRRAVRLPPAEAMHAEPPARFQRGWFERSGLATRVPSSVRMIARNLERKPLQMLLSSLGVAFSVAILVVGLFMFDGVRYLMAIQFGVIQREDLSVVFTNPVDPAVAGNFEKLDGVMRVEAFRTIPARLQVGHREREIAIQGVAAEAMLRSIVNAQGSVVALPATGIVISAVVAERLDLNVGDAIDLQFLDGLRRRTAVRVAGIAHDFLGVSATMEQDALNRLAGGPAMVNGVYLKVRDDARAAVEREMKQLSVVAGVTSPAAMQAAFDKQLSESLFVVIGFLTGFAAVIAVGVIYNGARIALSERGRELASLRVMGFRRREAALLLLGEQAVITIIAIPLGWAIGAILAALIARSMQSDTYRIPFVISGQTLLISALIIVVTAAVSAVIVRRRVDRLDLIAVLKTRE